jgi:hypothetical protein
MAGSLMESRFSLTLSRLPWCKHWNTISDSRTGKSVTAFFPTYSYSKLACLRLRLPESIPHNVEVIRTSSTGSQKLVPSTLPRPALANHVDVANTQE